MTWPEGRAPAGGDAIRRIGDSGRTRNRRRPYLQTGHTQGVGGQRHRLAVVGNLDILCLAYQYPIRWLSLVYRQGLASLCQLREERLASRVLDLHPAATGEDEV